MKNNALAIWGPEVGGPSALDKAALHILSPNILTSKCVQYQNKSAQSNLGRGPRRGAVSHVRRKVPIGYNDAPQIRP